MMAESFSIQKTDEIVPKKYTKLSIVLFIVGIIFLLLNLIVVLGIYYLNLGHRWALLSMTEWMYAGVIVFSLLIICALIVFVQYRIYIKMYYPDVSSDISSVGLTFKGKKLVVYTHPKSAEGGVFSKTHILIDNTTILNLRIHMISKDEMWP